MDLSKTNSSSGVSAKYWLLTNILERGACFSINASLGVLVTGMLLLLMCTLIAMDPPEIFVKSYPKFEVTMEKKEIVEQKDEKPEPPPEPTWEPKTTIDPALINTKIAMASPIDIVDITVDDESASDRAMSVVRVAPQYPRRGIQRGIEDVIY